MPTTLHSHSNCVTAEKTSVVKKKMAAAQSNGDNQP